MESQKIVRGCNGFKNKKELKIFDGECVEITQCPAKEIDFNSSIYLEAFHFYKQGLFPNAGSWLDMPAKLIDVLRFLDFFVLELEQKEQKENEKRMRSQHG
jgi:hypothetical protein